MVLESQNWSLLLSLDKLNNHNNHRNLFFFCLCVCSGDPYIYKLPGKCSFTLRKAGNGSSDWVPLRKDFAEVLVKQICQDLACGTIYSVNTNTSLPSSPCLHHCVYLDGRLQNCSESKGSTCTVITEAVCSKIFSDISYSYTKISLFYIFKSELDNFAQTGSEKKTIFYFF